MSEGAFGFAGFAGFAIFAGHALQGSVGGFGAFSLGNSIGNFYDVGKRERLRFDCVVTRYGHGSKP